MSVIIDITDRQDDIDFLAPLFRRAARGGYTVHLTIDDGSARTVFEGDVLLTGFTDGDVIVGREIVNGTQYDRVEFDLADVRRVEFY